MKKKILRTLLKIVVILMVFFASTMIAERIMNRGNTDMTMDMGPATLPIVYMNVNDEYANPLHGYTVDMQGSYLRGVITPLKANREVDILIDTYGAVISKIAYEVRSKDMDRLIEDTEVESYNYDDNMITATIPIKDLIVDDTEYMLVIKLTNSVGDVIRYYTRIINKSELYLTEKISFVKDFSTKTFDKEAARELKTYMETDSDGDNSSFGYVDIHSNFKQLTWGDLQPIVSSEKELYLLELDSLNASIELSYRVFIKNEYYNVKEYFRVKRGNDRIYLMEYERHMNQVFDEDKNILVNGKVLHGILDEELEWKENSSANMYCFVQQNALYALNTLNSNLSKVFSFYDKDNNDLRTRYDNHGIKILSVDDGGDMHFIVYGYMNRGLHEGEVGVCIYYYDNAVNTVEEELFIPYTKSFQMLKQNVNSLSYINSRNLLYMMLDGSVYRINMETKTVETVDSGLDENRFVSSEDNSMIAWQVGKELADFNTINFFALESKSPIQVQSQPGEIIIPLGFMDSDLIIGQAKLSDVTTSASGSTLVPMYALRIQNINGDVLKEYRVPGMYIQDVEIEDNMITVNRVVPNMELGFYEEVDSDQIVNNMSESITKNKYTSVVTEEMETTYQTELKKPPASDNLKNLTPKHVIFEGSRDLILEPEDTIERYYVYVMGRITGIYTDPAEAIIHAEPDFGVVIDKKDSYIWQSGSRYLSKTIKGIEETMVSGSTTTTAICVDEMLKQQGVYVDTKAMLSGNSVQGLLKEQLPDYEVLDLAGCSQEAVKYYVSGGYPVLAVVEGNQSVLIVGYDSANTTIFNPADGTITKLPKEETADWFQKNGNRFITYIYTKQ